MVWKKSKQERKTLKTEFSFVTYIKPLAQWFVAFG